MNVPTTATSPVSDHLRLSIVAYFVVHLILAILCDAQAVALFKYPEPLERLLEWHIEKNGDFLMAERPVWYVMVHCIISCRRHVERVVCIYPHRERGGT